MLLHRTAVKEKSFESGGRKKAAENGSLFGRTHTQGSAVHEAADGGGDTTAVEEMEAPGGSHQTDQPSLSSALASTCAFPRSDLE